MLYFFKFGPKPQMQISLRKGSATCNVSERCFFFLHLYFSLFHIQICKTEVTSGLGFQKHIISLHEQGGFFHERERVSYSSNTSLKLPSSETNWDNLKPEEWLAVEIAGEEGNLGEGVCLRSEGSSESSRCGGRREGRGLF